MRNIKSKRLAGNLSKFSPVKLLHYMVLLAAPPDVTIV